MSFDESPPPPPATRDAGKEDRTIDYLICRECSTPCYVFEMEGDRITEALCTVCGNDAPGEFSEGDLEEDS